MNPNLRPTSQDPERLARFDSLSAILSRRAVDIHCDWSWPDRASAAAERDEFSCLGALLAAISANYDALPPAVRDAFDAVEREIDEASDAEAERQLLRERGAL